jgi:hypothetical protein
MLKLILLYTHLLATCTAIGIIIATDLRLVGKIASPGLRIEPPNRYIEVLVAIALLLLYITGLSMIWLGLQERADYLSNPKLIAKILFVLVLTTNAFVLHLYTFPRLAHTRPIESWGLGERAALALPVALSNSLWMYCAFLGIARPWSYTMPFAEVLALGCAVIGAAFLAIMGALTLAARGRAQRRSFEATDVTDIMPREAQLAGVGID